MLLKYWFTTEFCGVPPDKATAASLANKVDKLSLSESVKALGLNDASKGFVASPLPYFAVYSF